MARANGSSMAWPSPRIVLPAFTAWAQTDLKRMFAYSSINHLGYCILGIVAVTGSTGAEASQVSAKAAALTGVMLQLFSHAITAAALFWFVALLARRSGGLTGLNDFGGLRRAMPVFSGLMGITLFASLGLAGADWFPGRISDLSKESSRWTGGRQRWLCSAC